MADTSAVHELDLVFAISTTSTNADEIFPKIKETAKTIVDKYGFERVRYAVIVFGTTPKVAVGLNDLLSDRETFKRLLDVIPRQRGTGDLTKTLLESQRLFQTATRRPNARKVLVLVMDKRSVSKPEEISKASKGLEDDEVIVVPVAVGREANSKELARTTTNDGYLVKTTKEVNPTNLAGQILDRSLKGVVLNCITSKEC